MVRADDPVAAATEVAAELIRTASAFLRQTVNAQAEAVLVVDPRQKIVHASEGAEAMFGYRPGAMEGLRVRELVAPELREIHDAHFAEFVTEPRSRPMKMLDAVPGYRRDETTALIQIGLSAIVGGDELVIVVVMRHVP
jgi:PAS domain S-box-containing protein